MQLQSGNNSLCKTALWIAGITVFYSIIEGVVPIRFGTDVRSCPKFI